MPFRFIISIVSCKENSCPSTSFVVCCPLVFLQSHHETVWGPEDSAHTPRSLELAASLSLYLVLIFEVLLFHKDFCPSQSLIIIFMSLNRYRMTPPRVTVLIDYELSIQILCLHDLGLVHLAARYFEVSQLSREGHWTDCGTAGSAFCIHSL